MYVPIEKTEVCRRASVLSDRVYRLVRQWSVFDQDTIGKQLVRAVDSIGANLVEGDARHSDPDSIRFFRYARSSAREARWWVARSTSRDVLSMDEGRALTDELTECAKMINGLIRFRANSNFKIKEDRALYDDLPSYTPNDLLI